MTKGGAKAVDAVVTLRLNAIGAALFTAIGDADAAHAAPAGAPVQPIVTEPVNPPIGVNTKSYFAAWPGPIVAEADPPVARLSEKSVAAPVNATVWGLPGTLSFTFITPMRGPAAAGLKTTFTVQEAPLLTFAPQLSVSEKSAAFAPPKEILLSARTPSPLFLTVTAAPGLAVPTSWPGNAMLVGKIVAAALSPVPANEIVCGLPAASSCIVTAAVWLPAAVGANDALITQLAPALRPGGQLLI
jgi:hypothetical protein